MIATVKAWLGRVWQWLAVAAGALLAAWLHGRASAKRAEAERQVKVERRAREASDKATAAKEQRDAAAQAKNEELRNEAAKGDESPVGPGVTAVLERMRAQQRGPSS